MRDSQRSKVYKAERLAFEGKEVMYPEVSEVEDYLKRIFKSKWLQKNYPMVNSFSVGDGRGRYHAGGFGFKGKCFLRLPRWSRSNWVILHELSHGIVCNKYTDVPHHGREYCQVYLSLVRKWMGVENEKRLKEKFKECRVKYVRRASSSYPLGSEDNLSHLPHEDVQHVAGQL